MRWRSPGLLTGTVTVGLLLTIGVCSGYPCLPTGLQYGVWAHRCPAGDLRLRASVDANNLVRNAWRDVGIDAEALWIEESVYGRIKPEYPLTRSLAVDLALLDGQGQPVDGLEWKDLSWGDTSGSLDVRVPDVPDGDYRLRTTIDAGFEKVDVDLELPFYRPALVHTMSDRPLYKPGQQVLLRSAVLRQSDSRPIGARPGTWRITDPSGLEMMVEKVPTDGFGVSATTFPLDSEAEVGTWSARFETGSDSDRITFQVKPFELPRFTVELEPNQRWYASNDTIRVEGTARYTSGAPVRDGQVRISLSSRSGRWPMPIAWEEPIEATTKADGTFSFELGEVPADLVDVAKIGVNAQITDEAKETQSGSATLTLSEQSLAIAAVTELRDGLVEKFNNRAYLRVTTPDGRPLRKASLRLSNPYDTTAPVMDAETDEDGVAAIQVDPGAPVTIVTPPAPVRIRPLTPDPVRLASAKEIPGNRALDLAERRALDRAHPAIARCGTLTIGSKGVDVGITVRPDGSIAASSTMDTPIARCVETATRTVRFPRGDWRTYQLTWRVPDSLQPFLAITGRSAQGSGGPTQAAIEQAGRAARRCMTRGQGKDESLFDVHWRQIEGSTRIGLQVEDLGSAGLSPSTRACVKRALVEAQLDEPAEEDAIGVQHVDLSVPKPPGTTKPRATTSTGFQFAVEAQQDGKAAGEGKLTLGVGSIPNLRLRATPTLAGPGQKVELEVLRGPDWRGTLPEKIHLRKNGSSVAEADLDPKTRRATFTIPADVEGFLEVAVGGAKTVIYARPAKELTVALSTDAEVYHPGDTAKLTVRTLAGEEGTPATVSLAGVDQTLSQLAPLLQPDDWGRVTVRAQGEDAFGTFGPRALQLGQIRGENAAKATVLLVNHLPHVSATEPGVYQDASVAPKETEALTTSFYRGLEALIAKVRAWERSAPKGEQITPKQTSDWWTQVLAEADPPIEDAYGMPLTLQTLPSDLLEQTAPHQLVADSTRLSEDIENWPRWVEEHLK